MSKAVAARRPVTGWRARHFHWITPSIFGWVILRSLLFLALYSGTMAFILAAVTEAAESVRLDRKPEPGLLLIASCFALVVNYLGCSLISSTLYGFGSEIRNFSLCGITKLWPLALRVLLVPLVLAFIIAPAGTVAAVVVFEVPLAQPWLFGINLALLHGLFCVGAAFVGVVPAFHRVAQRAIQALFPYRFLSGLLAMASFWVVFIAAQLMRLAGEYMGDDLMYALDQAALFTDRLIAVPAAGPLVVFWLNPYYLLMKMHSLEGTNAGAPAAFAVACLAAIAAMVLRLRYWSSVDLDERSIEVYDEWVMMRRQIPLDARGASAGLAGPVEWPAEPWASDEDEAEHEEEYQAAGSQWESTHEPGSPQSSDADVVPHRGQITESDFVLPADVKPEVFVAELTPAESPYPNTWVAGLLGASVLYSLFAEPTILIFAAAVWLALTMFSRYPVTMASLITPQKIWPVIGWVLRRRMPKILAVDAVIALAVVFVFRLELHHAIPIVVLMTGARLLVMNIEIAYAIQSRFVVLFGLFIAVVYGIMLVGLSVLSIEPENDWISWIYAGAAQGALAVQWVLLVVWLWRRDWLLHKESP